MQWELNHYTTLASTILYRSSKALSLLTPSEAGETHRPKIAPVHIRKLLNTRCNLRPKSGFCILISISGQNTTNCPVLPVVSLAFFARRELCGLNRHAAPLGAVAVAPLSATNERASRAFDAARSRRALVLGSDAPCSYPLTASLALGAIGPKPCHFPHKT